MAVPRYEDIFGSPGPSRPAAIGKSKVPRYEDVFSAPSLPEPAPYVGMGDVKATDDYTSKPVIESDPLTGIQWENYTPEPSPPPDVTVGGDFLTSYKATRPDIWTPVEYVDPISNQTITEYIVPQVEGQQYLSDDSNPWRKSLSENLVRLGGAAMIGAGQGTGVPALGNWIMERSYQNEVAKGTMRPEEYQKAMADIPDKDLYPSLGMVGGYGEEGAKEAGEFVGSILPFEVGGSILAAGGRAALSTPAAQKVIGAIVKRLGSRASTATIEEVGAVLDDAVKVGEVTPEEVAAIKDRIRAIGSREVDTGMGVTVTQPGVVPPLSRRLKLGTEPLLETEGAINAANLGPQFLTPKSVNGLSELPTESISNNIKAAEERLNKSIGEPGLTVVPRESAKEPGLLTPLKSPSRVAEKYPVLKPFVEAGNKAVEVQERFRGIFAKRLKAIEDTLAGGSSRLTDPLRSTSKQNKKDLYEILLTGDMEGKRYTAAELRARFGANDAVIKAYDLTRSAYDHAYTIANRTRDLRDKAPVSYREGYIPHFFHDWFIIADGEVVGSARTMREAVAEGRKLAGAQNVVIRPKQFEFPGGDIQAAVLGDTQYFTLKKKVASDFGISLSDAQALLEGVARMKGRSRFVGNFLERKGAVGWEQNLDWVNRHYFNMISRYAALDPFKANAITSFERQFGSFDKDHTGIAKYIKDYINDVNGVPTEIENLINNSLVKVPRVSQFLGKYLGSRPALQIAGATTKGVAVAKLGLYNVSTALINMTQLINLTAKLGGKWTAKGIQAAGGVGYSSLLKRMGIDVGPIKGAGTLKRIGVDYQLGLESGAGYSKAGLGNLFNKSTVAFQTAENFLRRSAALGAYKKGLAGGLTPEGAVKYAKQIVDSTMFNYTVADAPAFIRRTGPVGQVLFQFKKFPVKQLEFITQLKGAENARFWIPFTLLGGYYAFPGMENLKEAVKTTFGIDIELETKNHLMQWAGSDKNRQAIAKTIMYGAFSNVGVDVSKRTGMGDFIPSEVKDLAGPAVSTVVRAAQMAAKGEWTETLRAIAPAPGNIAVALQSDGEISDPWNRGRLKTRLSPSDRIIKATGFTPVSESIESDKAKIIPYKETKIKTQEQEVIDGLIKSLAAKDKENIKKYALKAKEMGIDDKRIEDELVKKMLLTSSERALVNTPKKRVEDYIDLTQFK
jgi:hypothetical protein